MAEGNFDGVDRATPDLVGALLCGGRSSRMGTDKALLAMRPGVRQLDYMLGLLSDACPCVVACTGPAGRSLVPSLPAHIAAIADPPDVAGPMAGVIAALEFAGADGVLAIACDMPWVDATVLNRLLQGRSVRALATAFGATDGRPEPMCAVYERAALPVLRQWAQNGRASLREFMMEARVELLPLDDPRLLASVNDRTELAEAHRYFALRDEN